MPPALSSALIAVIAALFGGAGLKIIEHFLSRGKTKIDIAKELRSELREEVLSLREELKEAQDEVDEWKQKYWEQHQELNVIKHAHNFCESEKHTLAEIVHECAEEHGGISDTTEMRIVEILRKAAEEGGG